MTIFHSYVTNYQRVSLNQCPAKEDKSDSNTHETETVLVWSLLFQDAPDPSWMQRRKEREQNRACHEMAIFLR